MVNLKINLYTTPGCEACNIMKNILHNAVELYKSATYVMIEYNIIEIATNLQGNMLAKSLSITDYPTTTFEVEKTDKLDFMHTRLVGTYPKDYIVKVIDNFIDSSI